MTKLTREVWSCPECGSFLVNQDAYYDVNQDEYSVFDNMSCGDCGHEGIGDFIHTQVPVDFNIYVDALPK